MLQALIIGQNKESNDLIKAVCCYKHCNVIVADNLLELNLLSKEKADIVLVDLDNLYSMALDLVFSSIKDGGVEGPVIIVSEKIDLELEIELQKRKIFYRLAEPLNAQETEQVINAAINFIETTKKYADEGDFAEVGLLEKQLDQHKLKKTSRKATNTVLEKTKNVDNKINSLVQRINVRYLDKTISLLRLPIDHFDKSIIRMIRKLAI